MRPYLIFTHPYTRKSAGVRALHRLAHELNACDHNAYIMPGAVNTEWDTPIADAALQAEIARDGIVVYPEVDEGNPLQARRPVRYVLNIPGLIRGTGKLPEAELQFAYTGLLTRYLRAPYVLQVPVVALDIFKPEPAVPERYGRLCWIGKGKDSPRIPETTNAVAITMDWPETWAELAREFRQAEVFYSYANYTMLTIEARLCGCPTVIIPNGRWYRHEFLQAAPGMAGLAWGPEELPHARETVRDFQAAYRAMVQQFPIQLDNFIRLTQEMP